MATEKLIVELDARTKKLDAKLQSTENKLNKLGGAVKENDKGFAGMGQTAKTLAGGLAKVATVAVAVGSAISAMVLASANNRRELETLSRQAKTTTGDFQALAFATKTYGINADQIADISKDISDKVGEFSAVGTGAFQDYADVMKLTAAEARQVAIDFEGLSSQQVIGEMVKQMESAGVSGDKMTFVLESMGNDLSKILPLFSENSRELNTLKARFNDVNSSMEITAEQSKELEKVTQSFDLMKSSIGKASTAISATLAPVLDGFINDILEVVPHATQTIIDFTNSFLDPENIKSQAGVEKEINSVEESLVSLRKEQAEYKEELKDTSILASWYELQLMSTNTNIRKQEERLKGLVEQLAALKEAREQAEDDERPKVKKIGGGTGEDIEDDDGIGTDAQIKAIEDRFKTEKDLLKEKYELEQEMLGEHHANLLDLEEEYHQALKDIDARKEQEIAEDKEKIEKDKEKDLKARLKMEQQLEKQGVKSIMDIMSGLVDSDSKIGKALFLNSQSLAMAETFVNTQAAAMKAMTLDPTGVLAAKVTAQGVLSMVAIGAATLGGLSGSGSGGSLSGGGGGDFSSGGSSTPEPQSTRDFEQDTARLEVSDSTSEGSTVQTINFSTDSGDELIDAIAAALNKAQAEGRT